MLGGVFLSNYPLRIPDTTLEKLKYISSYNGRSANKEIEQLILKHIAEFEKKHGNINLNEENNM